MNNQESIITLIKKLTGQANVLAIPRVFVDYMGDLDGALFLSQLVYWSDKGAEDGYFYKTYAEWTAETTLGEYEIRKAVKKLKAKGLASTQVKKVGGSPTVHYRLDVARFSDSILEFLQEPSLKNSRNDPIKTQGTILEKLQEPLYTETTAEITTETTAREEPTPKKPSKKRQPKTTEELIEYFSSKEAYQGIDVRREVNKAIVWCETNNRQLNQKFMLNWLNRIDAPIVTSQQEPRSGPFVRKETFSGLP